MRPQKRILTDTDFFVYPHDELVEDIIKKTDKVCDKYTCDECPLSLGILISPNVGDDATECLGVLLKNMYWRYQADREVQK